MCRMMGSISSKGFPVDEFEAFGTYAHSEISPDGRGQVDGWGLYLDDGKSNGYLGRQAKSAFGNLEFLASVQKLKGENGVAIVHLRNASRGSVRQENSHPFVNGRLALAHNGTVQFEGGPGEDVTDTELLFRYIVEKNASLNFHDALIDGIRQARSRKYTGLVLLATDGSSLFGFRDYIEPDAYYPLSYCSIEGGLMISQVKSKGHEWHDLGKGQLIAVRADGSYSLEEV